jgi:hypothetical protein
LLFLSGTLAQDALISAKKCIAEDTETCAPLRNAHDIKMGHGKGQYFVENGTALCAQYEEHIKRHKAYADVPVASDDEEDDGDED